MKEDRGGGDKRTRTVKKNTQKLDRPFSWSVVLRFGALNTRLCRKASVGGEKKKIQGKGETEKVNTRAVWLYIFACDAGGA